MPFLCPATIFPVQVALVVLALVAFTMAPATAAPVKQLRKLHKLDQATILWEPGVCRKWPNTVPCSTAFPSPACCNSQGCAANFDGSSGFCDVNMTYVACCPGVKATGSVKATSSVKAVSGVEETYDADYDIPTSNGGKATSG